MEKQHRDIVIIGAGLAGLTLAYRLNQKGIRPLILEARERIGGRIYTTELNGTTLELGATWFADKHQNLCSLVHELSIPFEQQFYGKIGIYESENGQVQPFEIAPQPEKTYRFSNGTSALLSTLAANINTKDILLNRAVQKISKSENSVSIETNQGSFEARLVINTLPPHLAINSIAYEPPLDKEIKNLAAKTHTWMGESIKVGFFSPTPFWKEKGIGTFYSQRGPITEMYDHSNAKGYAMKGFMHDQFIQLPKQEREKAVRLQLSNAFGEALIKKVTYVEMPWRQEEKSFLAYPDFVLPHQNNGNPSLRESQLDGRLYFAASETAQQFPGYMDGAVEAAMRSLHKISETSLAK